MKHRWYALIWLICVAGFGNLLAYCVAHMPEHLSYTVDNVLLVNGTAAAVVGLVVFAAVGFVWVCTMSWDDF